MKKDFPAKKGIKGAVYIVCPVCGKEYSCMLKEPKENFKCKCGNEIALVRLKRIKFTCECGKKWEYKTNIRRDNMFDFTCRKCGSFNALEWNSRRFCYTNV